MALELRGATTDRISHGTALGGFTKASWAFWFQHVGTIAGLRPLIQLWTGSFTAPVILSGNTTTQLRMSWRRGGGGSNLVYETNDAALVTGRWYYIVATVDQAAGAGVKVVWYRGDLVTPAVRLTNGTATDPTSGFLSNASAEFFVGDNGADSEAAAARWTQVMFWPGRVLTDGEARRQQFGEDGRPRQTPVVAGCRLNTLYNPAGRQLDRSGSGAHGTFAGGLSAPNMPWMTPLLDETWLAFVPAAPAGLAAPIFHSPIFRSRIFRSA